jgi:hypothetical protein
MEQCRSKDAKRRSNCGKLFDKYAGARRRPCPSPLVMQFESGKRILRVIHGWEARATLANCITTDF